MSPGVLVFHNNLFILAIVSEYENLDVSAT